MPQKPVATTLFVSQIVAGADITVTPAEGTGVVTISASGSETFASITASATPFPISGQAPATATSAGGEVDVTGGAGGATSGTGGAAKLTGGAGTAGNAAGGAASVAGGAGQGTAAGGATTVTGGASGAGATGNGGAATVAGGAAASTNGNGGAAAIDGGAGTGTGTGGGASAVAGAGGATGNGGTVAVTGGAGGATSGNGGQATVTGGAGTAGNGNGGDVVLSGGAPNGSGIAGNVVNRGTISVIHQPAASAQNAAATLTAAQILSGIITTAPSGAINLQLPLATAMDTAIPNSIANDAVDFSVINTAGSANTATLTTDTGWTLVGSMAVAQNVSARFRLQKTGAGAWTIFRLS